MALIFDRVAFETATTGTGTVEVGDPISGAFLSPAEAGASNNDSPIPYIIHDGEDFEIGTGTYKTGTPNTFERNTVIRSKISGTAGTTKLNLSGNAVVRFGWGSTEFAAIALKLDGIEAGADVTDATNVAAAGAVMDGDFSSNGLMTRTGAGTYTVTATASFSEFNSATASRVLANASVWASPVALTDGATIAVDLNNGYDFTVTLGGNRTLGAPSNVLHGKKGIIWVSASGSTRTLTLNGAWVLEDDAEEGPYEVATTERLGICYACDNTTARVTGILRYS